MRQFPRSALVIGATGTVGAALCAHLAADDVDVHAVGRNRPRLDEVAARTGARPYAVDLTDLDAALSVAGQIADAGCELAVAAVGGWYVAERTLALPGPRWRETIDGNLTTHFTAARAFAPALTGPRPVYLALNGIASHFPCEGSVAISVAGAGQRMLLDVLAAEGRDEAVTYAELVVDTPILLPGQTHDVDEPTHQMAEVYAAVLDLAASPATPGLALRRHLR